ncbi:amidase [Acetobacteraceae bacterium H6797]|nr:amidase [Acetobacteraceae bacterium H6797]
MRTIAEAAEALAAGKVTALELVEAALARIADPAGEGARAFVHVDAEGARAQARAIDALRATGAAPSPYAGIPISVKDLYDVAGQPTKAGSIALDGVAPAKTTAPSVQRLIRQGFIILGRTNMVEFAFSGLGHNPHYGTPLSPYDRKTGRLPGGSSSGAGVATADGMGFAALGSDTGGSCRIPAALCGVVGYKPTQKRIPLDGAYPLSQTLDSLGPLARSVGCCAIIDAFMAGEETAEPPKPAAMKGLRFALPKNTILTDGLQPEVAAAFDRALKTIAAAGAEIVELEIPELTEIPKAYAKGTFVVAESYAWHRDIIARAGDRYDQAILKRIKPGEAITAADYIALQAARPRIIAAAAARTAGFDAVIAPTTPLIPPALAEIEDEAEYGRINLLLLRNPSVANFLDRCAISLPCHKAGEAPVGLMLIGEHGADKALFSTAAAVEAALA